MADFSVQRRLLLWSGSMFCFSAISRDSMTTQDQLRLFFFVNGAALNRHRFVTVAFAKRGDPFDGAMPDHSVDTFDARSRSWTHIASLEPFVWAVSAYSPAVGQPPIAAALCLRGQVVVEGGRHGEAIHQNALTFDSLRGIGAHLYAVSSSGYFFVRSVEGKWRLLDPFFNRKAIPRPLEERFASASSAEEILNITEENRRAAAAMRAARTGPIKAIAGWAENDLYLAGDHGSLLHYDGIRIHRVHSGIDNDISLMTTDQSGNLYLGSTSGGVRLFKGTRATEFAPIFEADEAAHSVFSFAVFDETLYLADESDETGGLYRIVAGRAVPVPLPDQQGAVSLRKVDAADGVLWALTDTKLYRFDGQTWDTFTHPDAR